MSINFNLWFIKDQMVKLKEMRAYQDAYVILVLGLFGWPDRPHHPRPGALDPRARVRRRGAADRAPRVAGCTSRRSCPNLWAPLLVYFTLTMPAYISAEAALSYLGVGVKPPTPDARQHAHRLDLLLTADFFFFFIPAFLIVVIVVSFNLLGDGLRDALDPEGRR